MTSLATIEPLHAQTDTDPTVVAPAASAPTVEAGQDSLSTLTQRQQATSQELGALADAIQLSNETVARLSAEVDALRQDQIAIREGLIAAAAARNDIALRVAEAEGRFTGLRAREAVIQRSLDGRRGLLAEVLAALQRMGRNPPPAMLVSAQDALGSVRSAILLGSVVPDMRGELLRLVGDLEQLQALGVSIDEERQTLIAALEDQAGEQRRLDLLLAEKKRIEAESTRRMASEQANAERLAAEADGLEDLIASLESEIASVQAAAEEARMATQMREQQTDEQLRQARELAATRGLDAARIAPAFAFDALRGLLQKPVAGATERWFGDDDGTGHSLQGIMVSSRSGAPVTAPADAWVVYAGPFRSYGQLLILNAGDEYHIVLAGMDRIDVTPGQFVVAGEPVAAMGETRLAGATALALASEQPTLYIEFRKDGQPVDPDPWWANKTSGRASNDS
jgi:murein hydrolase activator